MQTGHTGVYQAKHTLSRKKLKKNQKKLFNKMLYIAIDNYTIS